MKDNFSKLISYIILCIAAVILFYLNTSLSDEVLNSLKIIYPAVHNIFVIFIICVVLSPLLGILMYLCKPFKICIEVILFILLSGLCVFLAFPSGMVIGQAGATFIFSLLPSLFAGAHFVCARLAMPSDTYTKLLQRGVRKSKIVRLTSFKLAYATVFYKADYLICAATASMFASSYILNISLADIFTLPSLILLICVFAALCLLSTLFAKVLYR